MRRPTIHRHLGTSVVHFSNRKYRMFLGTKLRIIFEIELDDHHCLWQTNNVL
jgi:hypothetical protein